MYEEIEISCIGCNFCGWHEKIDDSQLFFDDIQDAHDYMEVYYSKICPGCGIRYNVFDWSPAPEFFTMIKYRKDRKWYNPFSYMWKYRRKID